MGKKKGLSDDERMRGEGKIFSFSCCASRAGMGSPQKFLIEQITELFFHFFPYEHTFCTQIWQVKIK
jgi:hypothetical protein